MLKIKNSGFRNPSDFILTLETKFRECQLAFDRICFALIWPLLTGRQLTINQSINQPIDRPVFERLVRLLLFCCWCKFLYLFWHFSLLLCLSVSCLKRLMFAELVDSGFSFQCLLFMSGFPVSGVSHCMLFLCSDLAFAFLFRCVLQRVSSLWPGPVLSRCHSVAVHQLG